MVRIFYFFVCILFIQEAKLYTMNFESLNCCFPVNVTTINFYKQGMINRAPTRKIHYSIACDNKHFEMKIIKLLEGRMKSG